LPPGAGRGVVAWMLDVADAQAVGCLQHGRRVGHDRRRQVVGVGRIVTADGFDDKRNPVEPSDFAADRVTGTDCRLVGQDAGNRLN